jgi:[FeFe] hydrogenase H-cluster maturation GTPase HydF
MKGKDLKPHIGIFGRRNVGKSSFINALVNQEIAIVSDQAGTTTDPVKKSIEIFGIGPVILIDTAGIDDEGSLGEKRIGKTMEILKVIDCAILLIADNIFTKFEKDIIEKFNNYSIPFCIIHNKCDAQILSEELRGTIKALVASQIIETSTITRHNLEAVIAVLKNTIPTTTYQNTSIFKGILKEKDIVLLVTPIDSEAPDGRMILPQVMAIRDVLDNDSINIVLKETELEFFLKTTGITPRIVVTDSQAFGMVSKIIPEEIPLTGFSILFARIKGNFDAFLKGTPEISNLKDGDRVLIMESCTHRVSCEDIGQFKIPKWIKEFTGKNIEFDFASGFTPLAENLKKYALVVQCGGCMFTRTQVINRLKPAIEAGIPVTNYGMLIAYTNGIFERATQVFKSLQA